MKFFGWLMVANILVVILMLATSGKLRIFFCKVWGALFIVVIVTAGVLVRNGTLHN